MKYAQILKQWDEMIRRGQASQVQTFCRQLNHKKIPRELLLDYGQIARRVGAPDLVVLWLRPLVRSEKIKSRPATDQEKALYALGLLRLRAFREAWSLLQEVNSEVEPQVHFYRASYFMNQWQYQKAIPELKKYILHKSVPTYSRLVGMLNLCAALVSVGRLETAEQYIERLDRKLDREQNSLLKGNLLEIRAQLRYQQKKWERAIADLEAAYVLLKRADRRSQLYVEKWKILAQVKSNADAQQARLALEQLKKRAIEISDWETVRDCDFQVALVTRDPVLIRKVYWGSQFKAFKSRVQSEYAENLSHEKQWCWPNTVSKNNMTDASSNDLSVDLQANFPVMDLAADAPTPVLRRLFFSLTRDLYQPLRTTELLDFIYPEDYYHPIYGPMKLNRLIARARCWLQENHYPIQIRSYRNSYKIEFISSCQLILSTQFSNVTPVRIPEILKQKPFFKVHDWIEFYQVSARTARRQIHHLVKSGYLESWIRGPQTRYRFK